MVSREPPCTHLYGVELSVDNLNHSLDFFRGDRPGSRLFSQKIHDVSGELVTSLLVSGGKCFKF